MAKISVILPAYNSELYIGEAIESVLNQTWPNFELIVVDDGSTDRTASIIQAYGDRLRYVYQSNAQQAAARNKGISHASGDYLAFIDSDDVWLPEKLEKQMAKMLEDQNPGLVYCSVNEIDGQGRFIRTAPGRLRGRAMREILLGHGGCGGGSTMLVPAKVMQRVGGYDEQLSPVEDTDLFWRIAAYYPIEFIEDPLVLYRLHGGNSHRNVDRMADAWKLMYRKADSHPMVRDAGWLFRLLCRQRLNHMLCGDYAHAGRMIESIRYGLKAVFWWPPAAFRLIRKAI